MTTITLHLDTVLANRRHIFSPLGHRGTRTPYMIRDLRFTDQSVVFRQEQGIVKWK